MKLTDSGPFLVKYVDDITLICEFYKKLGLEPTDVTSDLATVAMGGHEIHFVQASSEPFEEYRYIDSKSNRGANDIILYIESTDLSSDYKIVVESGAIIKCEIIDNLWGAQEFLFQDPSGLNLSIYSLDT